jgi:hypothetical protein
LGWLNVHTTNAIAPRQMRFALLVVIAGSTDVKAAFFSPLPHIGNRYDLFEQTIRFPNNESITINRGVAIEAANHCMINLDYLNLVPMIAHRQTVF